jgi:assimilatory nitrate reductase catalytic subunit
VVVTAPVLQSAADPFSGQPETKATPARIEPLPVGHYGFLLSRQPLRPAGLAYWAHARTPFGHALNFALDAPREGWGAWLCVTLPDGERLSFEDPGAGTYRVAILCEGRLEAALFAGAAPKLPAPDWLKSLFAHVTISATDRRFLLAGTPTEGAADEGPIVCVCFQVGAKRIAAAAAGGCHSVEKVGWALGAGTNCGSCIPEIRRLIAPAPAGAVRELA